MHVPHIQFDSFEILNFASKSDPDILMHLFFESLIDTSRLP